MRVKDIVVTKTERKHYFKLALAPYILQCMMDLSNSDVCAQARRCHAIKLCAVFSLRIAEVLSKRHAWELCSAELVVCTSTLGAGGHILLMPLIIALSPVGCGRPSQVCNSAQ